MTRIFAFLVCASALFFCPVAAETGVSTAAATGGTPVTILVKDTVRTVISPVHYTKSDWLVFGAVAAAGAGLYAADGDITDFFRRNAVPADTSKIFKNLGDGKYIVPALAGAYGVGCLIKDEKLETAGILSVESFLISGLIANTVKLAAHRHRPNTGDGPHSFDGPSFNPGDTSFPSGHATIAFAAAATFAGVYDDKPAVAVTGYTMATLVGLSRVNDNAHWASDVFFGAAIGYFTGKAVVLYHNQRAAAKTEPGSSALPQTALLPSWNSGPGVNLLYRF